MTDGIEMQYSLRYHQTVDGNLTNFAVYDELTNEKIISLVPDVALDDHAIIVRIKRKYFFLKSVILFDDYPLPIVDILERCIDVQSGDLFCGYGRVYRRNKKNPTGKACQTIFLDSKPIVRRDGQLRFYSIGIRGVGNIDLEATGDIDSLYVQFNSLV